MVRTIWCAAMCLSGITVLVSGIMAISTFDTAWSLMLAVAVVVYMWGDRVGEKLHG